MNKINLYAPITPSTGYGITSTSIMRELLKDHEVSLFPLGQAQAETPEDKVLIEKILRDTNTKWDPNSPCLKIWHQYDLASRIGRGKYGALVFFEVDKITLQEKNMMNSTDCVFVASKWGKKILEDNGVSTKIVVSPLAVNMKIFSPMKEAGNKDLLEKEGTYRFINIGKWEIRKGHDVLVEAFNKAFTKDDKVELVMLNHNLFLNEQQNKNWQDLYKNSKLGDKIKIIGRLQTQADVANLIRQCNCGIFPARAEGWNNEILEVMAVNKPVIATNYSAHTEYCNKDNSYLVEIDNLVTAKDDMFFNGYGKWADIGKNQIDQIVEHMRFVYKNNIKTNPLGVDTADDYKWSNTCSIITKELMN